MTRSAGSPLDTPSAELILAWGTLRSTSISERVAAAARAGFDGIGLDASEHPRLADIGASSALADALDEHGMRVLELEVVLGFAGRGRRGMETLVPGGIPYADERTELALFEMADTFGCRHVIATGTLEGPLEDDAVEAFAGLCDRAADHGLLVALEFIPCTNIPHADVAVEIVRDAGRANGGLCVDAWHHYCGTGDAVELARIPPELVAVVQLDDGPPRRPTGDYVRDTTESRLLPGEGTFPLSDFLDAVGPATTGAPVSVEVLSADLGREPPSVIATRAYDATTSALAAGAARRQRSRG